MLAKRPKTTFISKYNPTPIFAIVKENLIEANISRAENILEKVRSWFTSSAKTNITKQLKNAVAFAIALSNALPRANPVSFLIYCFRMFWILFLKANYHPYNLVNLIPSITSVVT